MERAVGAAARSRENQERKETPPYFGAPQRPTRERRGGGKNSITHKGRKENSHNSSDAAQLQKKRLRGSDTGQVASGDPPKKKILGD